MITSNPYQQTREQFAIWQKQLQENILLPDSCLMHTYQCYFSAEPEFLQKLQSFAHQVTSYLEPAATENNLDDNLPQVEHYDAIGRRQDRVLHHPSYITAGNIIYGSGLMHYLLRPGEMRKTLSLFLLSSHAGEAGHNCPIACSAGVIRVLNHYSSIKETLHYLEKLTQPSFSENYTGAQFLTEIQGGSDVGANATSAYQDENQQWRIVGEKWFCSNANADLILMTARYDQKVTGTKGLGLFLVPSHLANGQQNDYHLRRLKEKIGTRSMATGEIDFDGALAYPMGEVNEGIHLVMENVLHLSRVFNAFSVLGMARRAYQIAYYYARNRQAFQHAIFEYPLVKETLAKIKAENTAMIASIFSMVYLQDDLDKLPAKEQAKEQQLLLRTLANLNKYFTAKRSVENIHHCLDILAGNGTIESFSTLPRLLRDCLVCENWEGTHFTLWMQTLRDMHKFNVDDIFLNYLWQLFQDIPAESLYKSLFKKNIEDLTNQINHMKTLTMPEQSLQIKTIIESMATLNAALTFELELNKGMPSEAKKACQALFIQNYLESKQVHDENYLALLDNVLASR